MRPDKTMAQACYYVLIIAHPDDESMFFVPTLTNLSDASEKKEVAVICLTTGDYDGMGSIRIHELKQAVALFGVKHLHIVHDDCNVVLDQPHRVWDIPHTVNIIDKAIKSVVSNMMGSDCTSLRQLNLITFDQYGVSNHVNHISTFHAVCQYAADYQVSHSDTILVWTLQTIHNPLLKYFPIMEWMLLLLCCMGLSQTRTTVATHSLSIADCNRKTYRCLRPSVSWRAMRAHHSQFVWYRRLFIIFSKYTYTNTLLLQAKSAMNASRAEHKKSPQKNFTFSPSSTNRQQQQSRIKKK